jgi:antitoxin ParD1/3/4
MEVRMISANISPEFEQFVFDAVAAGKYRSAEEVVADGLRLLREREIDALRKEIDVGLEQIERGEVIDIDDEVAHAALLEDIKARGRQRLGAGPSPR